MRKIYLAAGSVALAISAPVYADKGGKGGGDHGGQSMNEGRGHGGDKGGGQGQFQRGGDGGQSMRIERGHGNGHGKGDGGEFMRQAGNGKHEMKIHGNGHGFDERQAENFRHNDVKMRGNDRQWSDRSQAGCVDFAR